MTIITWIFDINIMVVANLLHIILIYFTDFEPLIRKKKKSIVTTNHPTSTSKAVSSSTPTIGRYGTSFCGPIHSSMSSFIQSALAESTVDSAGTAQIRKAVPVKASSSARSTSAAAKRRQGRGERGTRSTKKVKLGESLWTVEVSVLSCPSLDKYMYCDSIGHSESRGWAKRNEIVDLQLTNQIPDLHYPYKYLHYLLYHTLESSCNKYCDLIGHSEVRGCDKRSQIVDLQVINQIPDLLYPTMPTIPALP